MNLAPIALSNAALLYGLFALDWVPGTIASLFWFEAAVLTVLIVLKAIAELFNAMVDAQAGEWQRTDSASQV